MASKRNKIKIKVALMLDYMEMPVDQMYYLSNTPDARNLFGFLSMCMIHNAEINSKTWGPMIETLQNKRRLEREQRKTG